MQNENFLGWILLTSLQNGTIITLEGRKTQTTEVKIMLNNLAAEQKRHGYTNAEVANFLGISRPTYETKKRTGKFNRPQIEKLLQLFDCKFEYLFAYDTQKPAS